MGSETGSKAGELLGSLGVYNRRSSATHSDAARKQAYLAMFGAILLNERSRGSSIEDIERRWAITGLDGPDEAWRDAAIWILAGHAAVFEIRSFYYHLQAHCSADTGQIRDTKRAIARMRSQTYDLMEQLKYASPLGSMLRGIRASLYGFSDALVGIGTIRTLEESGITTLKQVSQMKLDDLEKPKSRPGSQNKLLAIQGAAYADRGVEFPETLHTRLEAEFEAQLSSLLK